MSANGFFQGFAMKVARGRIVGMLDLMIELRSRAEMMIIDFLERRCNVKELACDLSI